MLSRWNDSARSMAMMITAMLYLPGIDAIAKLLSSTISSGQIAWGRFFFQVILMAPLLLTTSGPWLNSGLWLHLARGTLIAVATLLFFQGLRYLPLADAMAIFFIEPLVVTLLSAIFLGERVGPRRLLAISTGFVGALIIIRPTFTDVGWSVLYPVGAAFCFAFYLLLTRKLVRNEDPVRLQFFAGVFGCIVMSTALFYGTENQLSILTAVWPGQREWLMLTGLGIIATSGHLLVVHAFRLAPAVGVLAPFQYIEIIGATVLGLLLFNEFPEPATWLGISIIIGSGIYIFHRESLLAQEYQKRPT